MQTIVQEKKTDRKKRRLKQMLDFFSSICRIVIQDEAKIPLLEQICTKMIESLGYHHAWIVLPIANDKDAFQIVSSPAEKVLYPQDRLGRGACLPVSGGPWDGTTSFQRTNFCVCPWTKQKP
jgi:hypothetical protein